MKRWWSNVVKDYFTFSKKERIAISILIAIAILFYLFPKFLKVDKKPVNNDAFAQELSQLKITIDSSRSYRNYRRDDEENEDDYNRPMRYSNTSKFKGELFEFDPNTLDESGWKKLGVRDKTVQTIIKFVGKGFKFRRPEDIKKIYGLHEDEAERLMPFIRIAGNNNQSFSSNENISTTGASTFAKEPTYRNSVIEVNGADTTAFIALPGIGSKLAARIVNFRDKLGGFVNIQQVAETYGLQDSTFQKIKPRLRCEPSTVRTFNVNTSDANLLKTHPYIKWNVANAIVNYRQQHGNFKSLEELKKIDIISEEIYNKLSPYLKVL